MIIIYNKKKGKRKEETYMQEADDNASVADSAFDDGDDDGAVPLWGPSCGSHVDGEVSSLYADGTGRDDADEDDRRAAGSPPSTDKHQDCDRPTCRALL